MDTSKVDTSKVGGSGERVYNNGSLGNASDRVRMRKWEGLLAAKARRRAVQKMAAFVYVLLYALALCGVGRGRAGSGGVEKIQIDPSTRMYRGVSDGRVYVFHGLDTEDSSPPWYLRTLDQQQIDLMKSVRHT